MSYQTNFNSKNNVTRIAQIEAVLRDKPTSMRELCDHLSLPSGTISTLMQHLRDRTYVAEWRVAERLKVAMWAWGQLDDAPRPAKYVRPSRSRIKAVVVEVVEERSPEERAAFVSQPRGFKPQPVRRDWAVEMMFGAAA